MSDTENGGEAAQFAIVAHSGKQYFVKVGQTIRVDYLGEELEPGAEVHLDRVLLVGGDGETRVGQPTVAGAKVVASLVEHGHDPKLHMVMYKRRKNFRRHRGHRQINSQLKILEIVG